jgi:AraC-like DNA-binding protein
VPLGSVSAWCEVALEIEVGADPGFALRWAERAPQTSLGPISTVLAHAPTLRDGLATLAHFDALAAHEPEFELVERGAEVELRSACAMGDSPRLCRFAAECTMLEWLRALRMIHGQLRLRRANFAYPAPTHRSEYTRLFDAAERFDQPVTGLVFDRAWLDARSLHDEVEIQGSLRILAEPLTGLQDRGSSAQRALGLLMNHHAPYRVDMQTVADWLDASLRTFQRRLAQERQPYGDLTREASASVAKRLLMSGERTTQEVASSMEFADVSSFYRAFKRWTGTTPSKFRRTQH